MRDVAVMGSSTSVIAIIRIIFEVHKIFSRDPLEIKSMSDMDYPRLKRKAI
jgi:hypothetical protein